MFVSMYMFQASFCYIAGVCYADTVVNPTDACRHCNVFVDTATWQLNVNDSGMLDVF